MRLVVRALSSGFYCPSEWPLSAGVFALRYPHLDCNGSEENAKISYSSQAPLLHNMIKSKYLHSRIALLPWVDDLFTLMHSNELDVFHFPSFIFFQGCRVFSPIFCCIFLNTLPRTLVLNDRQGRVEFHYSL